MKKNKIIFSTSGGAPALRLLTELFDYFGHDDISRMAAQIAAACRKARTEIIATENEEGWAFEGNTAKSILFEGDTIVLDADNVSIENNVLIISQWQL